MLIIYSLVGLVPSVISLESTTIIKVLPLLPAIVGVHFVGPGLALPVASIVVVGWLSVPVEVAIAVREAFLLFLLLLFLQLSLVVLLVVDGFEARKSLLWRYATFTFEKVHPYAVRSLLDSLQSESSFFSQTSLIGEVGLITQVIDTVKELASLTIHAVAFLLVLCAHLGLVVRWQVCLWYEFVLVVSVGAGVSVLAVTIHDDISAHLSLFHLLDFLIELKSFLLVDELLLLRRSCSFSCEA